MKNKPQLDTFFSNQSIEYRATDTRHAHNDVYYINDNYFILGLYYLKKEMDLSTNLNVLLKITEQIKARYCSDD